MNEEMKVRTGAPMHGSAMMSDNRNRGGSKLPWIVLILVVAVIAVVAVLFRDKWGGKDSAAVKRSEYQAVFLTNGQVYFGKLSNPHDSYMRMTDIYYLQVIQPALQGSQQQQQTQQQQPQLSLVKLGNELHGPVDEMHINRDQVLFYEDMKDDGKVMQAIKEHKANPNANNQQATPPPAAAPAPAPVQQTAPAPVAPTPAPATNTNR